MVEKAFAVLEPFNLINASLTRTFNLIGAACDQHWAENYELYVENKT